MSFAADPHWGWWIVGYFYLGGIAAGAHTTAVILDQVGGERARPLARIGYRLAFPLIAVCGILLIVDLDRPERFWHMLVRSEVVLEALEHGNWSSLWRAPSLKWWSPMSIGSWALLLFGLCCSVSFVGSLWPESKLDRFLRRSRVVRWVQFAGCLIGFFVAAYTGALVTATNQPLWSDTTWIAPLFLTSAISTGLAAITLLGIRRLTDADLLENLRRGEVVFLRLEAVFYLAFVVSLFLALGLRLFQGWHGMLLLGLVPLLGILFPIILHAARRLAGKWATPSAAVLILLGGFLLRYGVLIAAAELRANPVGMSPAAVEVEPASWLPGFSPEDGRERGGGPGADRGNRPADLDPRSKWSTKE